MEFCFSEHGMSLRPVVVKRLIRVLFVPKVRSLNSSNEINSGLFTEQLTREFSV